MTIAETILHIQSDLAAIATANAEREATVIQIEAERIRVLEELAAARDRIAELEAAPPVTPPEGGGGSAPKPPAILDERFTNGVDWSRYYSDAGGGPSAPRDRFMPTPDGLKVIWIAGSPNGTKRSELGIRRDAGGGETPRRDPIGSERWYALEFLVPDAYKLDDGTKDEKRVLFQMHQSGPNVVNPPLSLELRNGTLRLVRVVLGEEREHMLMPTAQPFAGVPCVKGVWHKLVLHVHWHATAGFIESWLDTLHTPKLERKTCNAVTDGMNVKTGTYLPGFSAFPSGYKLEHVVRAWKIGDETNSLEDMKGS